MSDDDDERVLLSHEELEQVVEWAVGTGALITLMHHANFSDDEEEKAEQIAAIKRGIALMYNNLPSCIEPATVALANESIEEAEHDQVIIDEFKEWLKEL